MAIEQYIFGAGTCYMVPQGIIGASPIQVGTLQETSIDLSWSEKELQGSLDAPVAIARGALKVTGKVKAAKFRVADIAQVVFGGAPSTGGTETVQNEGLPNGIAIPAGLSLSTSSATSSGDVLSFASTTGVAANMAISGTGIAAGSVVVSFTGTSVTMNKPVSGTVASATAITFGPSLTVVNAASFVDDLGVVNVSTGAQMTPVPSAPTTGEYSVSNGVYEFAAADAGQLVAFSYSYTQTMAGASFTYYAQPMGFRPVFKLLLSNRGYMNNPAYAGQPVGATLWSCGISKFSLDFKNEDWNIPESDISASADFMNRVITLSADK